MNLFKGMLNYENKMEPGVYQLEIRFKKLVVFFIIEECRLSQKNM